MPAGTLLLQYLFRVYLKCCREGANRYCVVLRHAIVVSQHDTAHCGTGPCALHGTVETSSDALRQLAEPGNGTSSEQELLLELRQAARLCTQPVHLCLLCLCQAHHPFKLCTDILRSNRRPLVCHHRFTEAHSLCPHRLQRVVHHSVQQAVHGFPAVQSLFGRGSKLLDLLSGGRVFPLDHHFGCRTLRHLQLPLHAFLHVRSRLQSVVSLRPSTVH
mmetsp:Transcript_7979/g.19545  ORF Transcript_7979/g.19545 Transcript_7979/m.19545 type:complete len:217 (-) Transcript_7979:46-696(-)